MRAGIVDQPEIKRELENLGRRSPEDGGGVDIFKRGGGFAMRRLVC